MSDIHCVQKKKTENKKYGARRLLTMFPNKNWSLVALKVLMKKLTTQVGLLLFDILGISAWLRGPAVEHWSLADVLSLSCARLVADG